jgi:hypothetical protein
MDTVGLLEKVSKRRPKVSLNGWKMGLDNNRRGHTTRTAVGITVLAGLLILVALAQPFNNTQPYSKNPRLESVLSNLISANNPQEFARAHDLYMHDRNVRVVVELTNETALLPDYAVEETRYKNKIQVLVPIEKIGALSLENNVTFIRAPSKAYPDAPMPAGVPTFTAVQTPVPKSGFNTTIPIILSIVLIFLVNKIRSDKNVKK